MKKIIGIIVIVLLIPVVIVTISDIDRTPVYPTTEFNIEKLSRISSLDIENNDIELPKLPNGVGDRWLSDGTVERKVGNVSYNGDENWGVYKNFTNNMVFSVSFGIQIVNKESSISNYHSYNYNCYLDGFLGYTWIDNINNIYIQIEKSKLSSHDAEGFKEYLSRNPITIYFELATPTIENASILPEYIDFYDGGSVIVDDGIIDYTIVENQARINYIEGNITTVVDGQFVISKPSKIISKSNDLYGYDLSNLPSYIEYGSLPQGTYDNVLEFNNNNQNKQIKLFFDDNIQNSRYNVYLENNTIIISNDTEVIRIFNDDTYTSTKNLDTNITYKLEGYHITDYIDGKFDNRVLAFFWIIPVLLAGGLIYLLIKRKE